MDYFLKSIEAQSVEEHSFLTDHAGTSVI